MLTQKRLKQAVSYNISTGIFQSIQRSRGVKIDEPLGRIITTKSGNKYRRISIDGSQYLAHRLAWLYVHGSFPEKTIDHIDGDGLNNAISNLRDVSYSDNQKNSKLRKDNKSGVTGVRLNKINNKWRVQITSGGKQIHLGYFAKDNKVGAIKARKEAESKYNFHIGHGKRL